MTWLDALRTQAIHHHTCWSELVARATDEMAQVRLSPGGPNLAWLMAHCIEEADSTLEAVGAQARIAGIAGLDQPTWDGLVSAWSQTSEALLEALAKMGPGDLDQPCAVELHPAFGETLRTRRHWLQGHVFHMAYHLGQGSMLRAATERIPPADQ